ncbi:hypothetical protein H7R52_15160 [Weissella confusa]|uniref:Uncharacterized protein n=1 Tax=Weissella confusa TaxID=1583 RepID=A0A923SNW3_WEICO|nr:hypothetical protein [Weissella confusa]
MQQSDKVTMLKDSFLAELEGTFAVSLADATDLQRYQALATVAKKLIASKWRRTKENYCITRFQEREPDSGSSNLMLAPLVG